MNKDVVYIHTHIMEYYSAIKKNAIMPFAATWMDLELFFKEFVFFVQRVLRL